MEYKKPPAINQFYLVVVVVLTIILPVVSLIVECIFDTTKLPSLALIGKWFIFWAVGFRLLLAGIRQIFNPGFTAREIFNVTNSDSNSIVRELGFANFCAGVIGIVSLFFPSWRLVCAFSSGMYYGLAALLHTIKGSSGPNEGIALVSDIFIFAGLAVYTIYFF